MTKYVIDRRAVMSILYNHTSAANADGNIRRHYVEVVDEIEALPVIEVEVKRWVL